MYKTNTTCVVIVTYGKRWHLLSQVLQQLFIHDHAIVKIIVVDNGSGDRIQERVLELNIPIIEVIKLNENSGSANGYKIGINHALKTEADYIWLLDDDNKPLDHCLERLFHAYQLLGNTPLNSLLCLRRDRGEYLRAAYEGKIVTNKKNSFLGFHLKSLPLRFFNKIRQEKTRSETNYFRYPLVSVDYGPYGGLLIHRNCLEKIGLPNEKFFLYADDHEFTNRIVQKGGHIYLCASAEVEDVEASWHVGRGSIYSFVSLSSDPMRIYYSIRNRTFLERSRFVSNYPIYLLNIIFFYILVIIYGTIFNRRPMPLIKRLCIISHAIYDGFKGNLGQTYP
jgi:GT2 family glycosyltransferase